MIILDTNVISEPTKPLADSRVVQWLNGQQRSKLYLTAINLGEMLQGIAVLPEGARKTLLKARAHELTSRYLTNPVLPFDEPSAIALAEITSRAKASQYTVGVADAQIAAIALSHGFSIATRDVEPFLKAGLTVINPWDESAKNV